MDKKLLLNLSFPLCPKACDYCHYRPIKAGAGPASAYVKALMKELEAAAADFSAHSLLAVHLGGGMPAMLKGIELRSLLRCIKSNFKLEGRGEFTVECTPNGLSVDFLSSMDGAFRLRPEFGFLSSNAEELLALGAHYNYGSFQDAMELIRCRDLSDFSFTLLYGLFKQTEKSLVFSIEKALELGVPHICLAPFRLHPDSVCAGMVAQGRLPKPETENYTALYSAGRQKLCKEGFREYAKGHFALPGHESQYLLGSLGGSEVLGAGLLARSRFEDMELLNTGNFKAYVEHPEDPAVSCMKSRILSRKEQELEKLFQGLQKDAGVLFPTTHRALEEELLSKGLLLKREGLLFVSDHAAADMELRLLPYFR